MSLGRFSTFAIVLTAFFGSSFCLNIIPDYFMNSGGLGNCGETINNKEDVYIRSHTGAYQLGSIINYGANENCELTFNAGTGILSLYINQVELLKYQFKFTIL